MGGGRGQGVGGGQEGGEILKKGNKDGGSAPLEKEGAMKWHTISKRKKEKERKRKREEEEEEEEEEKMK